MVPKECSVEECDKSVLTAGWCHTHYHRWRLNGDPNLTVSNKVCTVDRCGKSVQAVEWCNAHYLRYLRHGDPVAGGQSKVRDLDEKFNARTIRQGECLVWTAGRKSSGYGKMLANGKSTPVHRWAYERFVGPIPDGMEIDHLCFNRLCCEPKHLRVVTHKQNNENHQGALVTSTTGIRGVWWNTRLSKYQVEVKHEGRKHYGGQFDNLIEAEAVAIALRNELFTHNNIDRIIVLPGLPCPRR